MDIGPFRARETILQSRDGTVYHSRELRTLTPYRATFGYDVLVRVGRALFMHCRSEQEIIEDLLRDNVVISQREIGFLGKKFIVYLHSSPAKPASIKTSDGFAGRVYFAS